MASNTMLPYYNGKRVDKRSGGLILRHEQGWQCTVRYTSIFDKKYGTLVRYAFFVKVRARYVGKLFELKIPDFSHIAPDFCLQKQKQLKPTLNV